MSGGQLKRELGDKGMVAGGQVGWEMGESTPCPVSTPSYIGKLSKKIFITIKMMPMWLLSSILMQIVTETIVG